MLLKASSNPVLAAWQLTGETEKSRISLALSRLAPGLICALALWVAGCAGATVEPLQVFQGGPALTEFWASGLARIQDVQRRYPQGASETSPYGAPAYKLSNISAGSVDYRTVIFEFTEDSGMQLVIAHFTPSSTGEVYQQFKSALGEPSSSGGTNAADPSTVAASWQLAKGDMVSFNGPARSLVMLGAMGQELKQDIELRETNTPEMITEPADQSTLRYNQDLNPPSADFR